MKNWKLVVGILILGFGIFAAASSAEAVMIPAKSAVNPLTQTLYAINNAVTPAEIKAYNRNEMSGTDPEHNGGWEKKPAAIINLPGKAKAYSLAVSADGSKLFVPVNDGSNSKLRIYNLDSAGLPDGSYSDATGWKPTSLSSPMGVALSPSGLVAYLADAGERKIHVFRFNGSTWQHAVSTGGTSELTGIYDVAATSSKLFVSRKTKLGKIFVYNLSLGPLHYPWVGLPSNTPSATIDDNLVAPTYLKISPDEARLYVAVNGSDGAAIKIYNTSDNNLRATITCDIKEAYDWVGFDLAPDESKLIFSKSKAANNDYGFLTRVYYYDNPASASGTVPAPEQQWYWEDWFNGINVGSFEPDSLVYSPDRRRYVLTYSSGAGNKPNTSDSEQPYINPVVQSIAPASTHIGKEVNVTITGNYFLSVSKVYLYPVKYDLHPNKWVELANIEVVSSKKITATVTADITKKLGPGSYGVRVVSPLGSIGGPTSWPKAPSGVLKSGSFEIIEPNLPPNKPTNLKQEVFIDMPSPYPGYYKTIATGETITFNNTTIRFRFMMSDPNTTYPIILTPEVEVDISDGTSRSTTTRRYSGWGDHFTNPAIYKGTPVEGIVVINPPQAEGIYNWRARVVDDKGLASEWVEFYPEGDDFIVKLGIPAPTITAVYPNRAPNTSATEIVIEGTNFVDQAVVEIMTSPEATPLAVSRYTPNRIEATVPSGLIPGTYDITVTTPGGTATAANAFEVMTAPDTSPPQVTDLVVIPGDQQNTLRWTNPDDTDMAQITVRRTGPFPPPVNPVNYPKDQTEGTPIYPTSETLTPKPGEAIKIVDSGLTNDQVYYYAVFIRDTSGNWSVLDYDTAGGQNAATGMPTEGGQQGSITNLNIVRDGDTVGSSVTISWQTVPTPHSPIKLYTKTGTFSATAADWTEVPNPAIISNGDLDTYTDASQVGNGIAKYYKIIPASATLQDSDLTSEVVGKFDIDVGPSDSEPEKFFISIPMVPIAPKTSSLADVFGAQVSDGDGLLTFDMNKDVVAGSLYSKGTWEAFPGATEITEIKLGRAYGYLTMTAKHISIVGKVLDTANGPLSLAGGWDIPNDRAAVAEWIGNAYPMPVSISASGLGDATSQGSNSLDSGTIYQFDANADLINDFNGMAVNTSKGWLNGMLNEPSPLQLIPGRGYMLNEPLKNPFFWTQPKPY